MKGAYSMNIVKSFKNLSCFERRLLGGSISVIIISFVASGSQDYMSLIASLIGATGLIFVAKGDVLGQIITMIFSLFYAYISYQCRYYGEMITYLGMTAPIALMAVITWLRNPYSDNEVKVRKIGRAGFALLALAAVVVTVAFYFILKYFNTANLIWSTVSITTSFMAASLTMLRSKYYALWYALNDIVLIILWIMAGGSDFKYLSMIICFCIFLINDIYGYIQWCTMEKRQNEDYC